MCQTRAVIRYVSLTFLCAAAVFAQAPGAPGPLTVVSATSTQTQLSWGGVSGATGYAVQRKTFGNDYATINTVKVTTAADSTIVPSTAYSYRIVALNDAGPSNPSNEVVVGPPPFGFSVAFPGPADPVLLGRSGNAVRMVLDSNGDPALAYLIQDPNNNNDFTAGILQFVNWNRAQYQWNPPVTVAVTGDVLGSGAVIPISLARDASTNRYGLAYVFQDPNGAGSRVGIARSNDNGLTWNKQTVASDPGNGAYAAPSLGMANNQVFLAFFHNNDGVRYVSGAGDDDAPNWSYQLIPLPGGFSDYRHNVSLAVDSAGNPGVAFIATGDSDTAEAFWRPNNSTVVVMSNNGHQTDDPDLQLSFFGTQPRIAYSGSRDDQFYANAGHDLWVSRALDNGGNWTPGINLPPDGDRSMNGPLWIDNGSRGQSAVVTESNAGSNTGQVCGYPRLSRSDDFLNWTTCGIAPLRSPDFAAYFPVVRFGFNDKLWIAFKNDSTSGDLPTGVLVWREQ